MEFCNTFQRLIGCIMHAIEFSSSSCYCFLGTCLFEIHARTIIALFFVVVSPHFSLMSLPPDNFFRQTVHKQRSLVLRLCAFGFLSHALEISSAFGKQELFFLGLLVL